MGVDDSPTHDVVERRFTEFRAEGRTLSGVVVPYSAPTNIWDGERRFREQFEPGSFGDVLRIDATMNLMHLPSRIIARTGGGGLRLIDTPTDLRAFATLEDTRDGDDALRMVRARILRGFSSEFRARRETFEGDLRRIFEASLSGIGVVDRPQYVEGLEVRVRGRVLTGLIPTGRRLGCKCQGPTCNAVTFDGDSLEVLDSVIAVNGGYGSPLASARRGGVRWRSTPEGLVVEIDVPDNEVGEQLLEVADAVPVYVRPYLDRERSRYEQDGDLRRYSLAIIRALIVGATDADEGLSEIAVRAGRESRATRRRVLWPSL